MNDGEQDTLSSPLIGRVLAILGSWWLPAIVGAIIGAVVLFR